MSVQGNRALNDGYLSVDPYYTECKPKNENGGGLGTRLSRYMNLALVHRG